MKDAFGVERSEVSKGLPSALRGAVKAGDLKGMSQYAKLRAVNNSMGRAAGNPTTPNTVAGARQLGGAGKDAQRYLLSGRKGRLGRSNGSRARMDSARSTREALAITRPSRTQVLP